MERPSHRVHPNDSSILLGSILEQKGLGQSSTVRDRTWTVQLNSKHTTNRAILLDQTLSVINEGDKMEIKCVCDAVWIKRNKLEPHWWLNLITRLMRPSP